MEYFNVHAILTISAILCFGGGLAIVLLCTNRAIETIGSIFLLAGGVFLGIIFTTPKASAFVHGVRPQVPNVSQVIISPDGKSVDFPEPTLEGAQWVVVHRSSTDQKRGEFVRNLRYLSANELNDVEVFLQFRDDTTSERVQVRKWPVPPPSVPAGTSTSRPAAGS